MIVEGEVKAQHLSEDHARGIAALPRATKDYERNPTTEAGDPYRPFDIATRAIQLLFPDTTENDIQLPAFEYSTVIAPLPAEEFAQLKTCRSTDK